MRYRVITESGTEYIIDDETRELLRCPHADANRLRRDYEVQHYVSISPLPCELSKSIGDVIFVTADEDYWLRSTPIVSVEELDDNDR